jgi:hypothetical protein
MADVRHQEAFTISKYLQSKPCAMPVTLWKALRGHRGAVIRTFSEHRQHLFRALAEEVMEDNSFCNHMDYLLKACISNHPSTQDKTYKIVDGGQLGFRSFYDSRQKTWKLDKKLFDVHHPRTWIQYDGRKNHLPESSDDYELLWDRPVTRIYALMISDLKYKDLKLTTTADGQDEAIPKLQSDY